MRRRLAALLLTALMLSACGRRGSLPAPAPWPQPHPELRSVQVRVNPAGAVVQIAAVPLHDTATELQCSQEIPSYPWAEVTFVPCARLPAGNPATTVTLPATTTALRLQRDHSPGSTVILEPGWRAAAYGVDATAIPQSWLYYRDTTSSTAVAPIDGRVRRLVRDLAGLRVYGPPEPVPAGTTAR